MFEAQRLWNFRIGAFADYFRYQYVITKEPEHIDGFHTLQCGTLHVTVGSKLPACKLTDKNGQNIGMVLGIAVSETALLEPTTAQLPLDAGSPEFWDDFEHFIVSVAGRFAFIMHHGTETRLYTDPVGIIGAVYNPEEKIAAASTLMAMKRPHIPNPKFDLSAVQEKGGKIPLFHTSDAVVKRLNPNYYLDLNSFTCHRFWPRDEDFSTPPDNPMSIYKEIAERAAFNIGAIARHSPCAMPVTGGQDSRLLLAFAKPHRTDIDLFYTHFQNYASQRDAVIGKALCDAAGVAHEAHEPNDFALNRKDLRLRKRAYQLTSGFGGPLPREHQDNSVSGVPEGHVILRGHLTDLLRAVFVFRKKAHWRKADWQIERLLIVPRKEFNKDIADQFRDEFHAWQSTLPDTAMDKAADFMFLELYYNASVGMSFPALWRNFYLSPFNSRKLIALSLQFSEAARRKSHPVVDMIEMLDAPLSGVPFDFELEGGIQEMKTKVKDASLTHSRRKETQRRLASYAPTRSQMTLTA